MSKRSEIHKNLPLELRIEIPNYQPFVEIGKKKKRKCYVNWNKIWDGSISRHSRAAYETAIKDYLKVFILKSNIEIPKDWYGNIATELEIHKKISRRWDTDNQTIWYKGFHDSLVDLGYIPDDNCTIIKSSGKVTWIPIEKNDNINLNKLVFIIKKI